MKREPSDVWATPRPAQVAVTDPSSTTTRRAIPGWMDPSGMERGPTGGIAGFAALADPEDRQVPRPTRSIVAIGMPRRRHLFLDRFTSVREARSR
jgi:hypothetical protein